MARRTLVALLLAAIAILVAMMVALFALVDVLSSLVVASPIVVLIVLIVFVLIMIAPAFALTRIRLTTVTDRRLLVRAPVELTFDMLCDPRRRPPTAATVEVIPEGPLAAGSRIVTRSPISQKRSEILRYERPWLMTFRSEIDVLYRRRQTILEVEDRLSAVADGTLLERHEVVRTSVLSTGLRRLLPDATGKALVLLAATIEWTVRSSAQPSQL